MSARRGRRLWQYGGVGGDDATTAAQKSTPSSDARRKIGTAPPKARL